MKIFKPRSQWGRQPRCSIFAALFGSSLGAFISWWFSSPPTPWIEFEEMSATYRLGEPDVRFVGKHIVNEECVNENHGMVFPVWHSEIITSSGPILPFAPNPERPPLTVGEHRFALLLALPNPNMVPKGWHVRVIVTCSSQDSSILVSEAVPVIVLDFEEASPPWGR